jgi:hypothetical protein
VILLFWIYKHQLRITKDRRQKHTFNQFPKYHMEFLLQNLIPNVRREDVKSAIRNESLHEINNDYRVTVLNFSTSKILIFLLTVF